MKLTKQTVEKLRVPAPDSGRVKQVIYRDSELPGFAVRVTSTGIKSFVAERRVGNKNRRVTIGRFGVYTVEQARREALHLLHDMACGNDPVAMRRAERARQVTVKQAFEDYLAAHPNLTRHTVRDYERSLEGPFRDWQNKPLTEITKFMIESRHKAIGRTSQARANNAMRVLRAMFNYAMDTYDDADGQPVLPSNPVSRLSRTRGWFQVERRRTLIKPHQLPAWYAATLELRSETARDYLHLTLLTGLRRGESARLEWRDIDFEDRTLTVRETKNREIHVLPLSDFLYALLRRRQAVYGAGALCLPQRHQGGAFWRSQISGNTGR